MDELLNPLGSTGSNPNREAPCLVIELDRFSGQVVFPTMEQIEEYASFVSPLESMGEESPENWTENDKDQIHEIIKRDPLSEILEQEKMLLWRMRYYCYTVPNSLPKLLDASKWNCRDHVAQLYRLLKKWKRVSPETALELLDCKYADMFVRKYAVEWLDGLSDELLSQYLLQLVQVLKYEPYLENDLGKFLIRRSLLNYNIGHFFFWHLKSEMHDPSVAVRFGLLLEGFCRGIGTHLKSVVRQVGALEKLTQLTDSLKERKDDTPKRSPTSPERRDSTDGKECVAHRLKSRTVLTAPDAARENLSGGSPRGATVNIRYRVRELNVTPPFPARQTARRADMSGHENGRKAGKPAQRQRASLNSHIPLS
ncbi:hypothetical protein HPB51_001501 [Rhipicephalus microplus]|uniref:PIK helical domain-containing protein n=1 Tax=Rhipicephalus microplus TaxID=6941 RepID=A0A9J6EV48_RHIMP|nr:hypothetical protein HPB51_001501 [Rhipicephalus microplus]